MRLSILLAVFAAGVTFAARKASAAAPAAFSTPDVLPLQQPEPPAKITLDPPDPGVLKRGGVYLRYHVENMRIAPVLGPKAADVAPRLGHLHVTVDGAPWHWVDFSGSPIIVFGLPPGPHKIEVVLADANHKELDRATSSFTIPEPNR